MKKNISQIFGLLLILSIVSVSAVVSDGNLLFTLLSVPVSAYILQVYFGVTFEVTGGLCTLAAIPKIACGSDNTPGITRLYIISSDKIEGNWPKTVDVTAGEITVAPTITSGATFVEVGITPKTTKIDASLKGAARHQVWEHMLEGKIAFS